MNRKEIKSELILESEKILSLYTSREAKGLDKLKALTEHLSSFEEYYKLIIDKLNEILIKRDVDFKNDHDKNDFMKFIKPTIIDLCRKHLNNLN